MNNKLYKLIITKPDFYKKPSNTRLLLIYEENKLVDLELIDINNLLLNSIHVAKVKNIIKSLNLAFVEIEMNSKKSLVCYRINNEKNIFLNSKKNNIITQGDDILIQISKEPSRNKNASSTSLIRIITLFSIVSIGSGNIFYSSKIKNKKFKNFMKEEIEKRFGSELKNIDITIRSNASEQSLDSYEYLFEDINKNINTLTRILVEAKYYRSPSCIKKSNDEFLEFIKLYYENLKEIVYDDEEFVESLKNDENISFLFEKFDIKLRYYDDKEFNLNKLYSIKTSLKELINTKVWLKSGAYLVIETFEAFNIIDINTGKNISKNTNEKIIYDVNREAAIEIARQIRLRNLAGIILVDFINMNNKELKTKILNVLNKEFKKDRVKVEAVDFTALELCEITRQRKKKNLKEICQEIFAL